MNKLKTVMFTLGIITQINAYAISTKRVDELAQAFMVKNNVEGMSVAVIENGQTRIRNYGIANSQSNTPTTNDTIYTIASFTKTVTATLAAIAVTENKLNLDAPFNQYIPELKNFANLNNITTRELLGHVGSFPFEFQPAPKNYSEVVNVLNHYVPSVLPGSEYQYSNVSIGAAGYVLQNVYAKNYQHILNDKLLKPLDMHSTYLIVPAAKESLMALGHTPDSQPVPYAKSDDVWFAATKLKSNIVDMSKYLNAHLDPSTVKDKVVATAIPKAHENNYCFSNKLSCEQLAWQAHIISELQNSTGDSGFIAFNADGNPIFAKQAIVPNTEFAKTKLFIDKTGSGYGMSSYMAYIPEDKTGVVILINKTIGDERIRLGRDILADNNEQQAINKLVHEYMSAYEHRDAKTIGKFYTPTATVIGTGSDEIIQGRKQIIAAFKRDFAQSTAATVSTEEITHHILGNNAWVSYFVLVDV